MAWVAVLTMGVWATTACASDQPAEVAGDLGAVLPVWSAIPFAGMLLSIALFPLLAPGFWHHNYPRVAAAWSAVVVVHLLTYGERALHELVYVAIVDYVPFLILLGTLFTIGGGIFVR